MEVLKPPLIYVEGRCYRINNADYTDSKQTGVEWDDYPGNYGSECMTDEQCDGEGEEEFEIVTTDSGRFKTTFHVAKVYYAPIIGARGQMRKRIEDETKTIIKVPRHPQDNEIVVTGASRRAVAAARRRVQLIVLSFRRKQHFTHFLSIPMVTPTVKERFLQFKTEVLEKCRARGVDDSLFQTPDKLHLTLCTMVLNDTVERAEAIKVLKQCKKDVIDPLMEGNVCTILLEGVEYMNDDPSEVDVLYAKVHANDILQILVDDVVNYCADAGLVDKQFDRVKLHVTIMNTLFRSSRPEQYEAASSRETFNARPILEMFRDFEFGEVVIDTIHLSTRHSTSKTDGYYQNTTTVSLAL